jgi:hypothetical protein
MPPVRAASEHALRWARAKSRLRLRAIVETEYRRDHTVQFARQMDCSGSPAIGAAGMLEGLQIDAECVIELADRTGEHDGAARRVFFDDSKTMGVGELPDYVDICGLGAELLGKLFAAQMPIQPLAGGQLRHSTFQSVAVAMAQNHADFQPLGRVCFTNGSRPAHGLPVATDKCTVRHR